MSELPTRSARLEETIGRVVFGEVPVYGDEIVGAIADCEAWIREHTESAGESRSLG